MKSAFERLEHGLTAAAAGFEPGPLLEWQQVTQPRGAVAMRAGFRTVDGLRIRYATSGGHAQRTVLLTSPWPESLYAFAPIWPALTARFRVVAVDLPGFGASEARPELRSPRAMGGFLVGLIDEWELGRPHLVGPDVGTSAALFATLLSPGSVTSVVVGSGGAAVPLELGSPLRDWTLDPDLARFRELDSDAVVDAALSTVVGYEFPQDIREDYHGCYAGGRFAESMAYVRRYPDELPELAARLGEIKTPVMVFAGLEIASSRSATLSFWPSVCPTPGRPPSGPAISSGRKRLRRSRNCCANGLTNTTNDNDGGFNVQHTDQQ